MVSTPRAVITPLAEEQERLAERTAQVVQVNEASRQESSEFQRTEEERARFFMLSIDMFCVAGLDGYFKQLNPAWERILGFPQEELQAKPFLEFVHPEDREATSGKMHTLGAGSDTIAFENRYRCKDGSYKWLVWNSTMSPDRNMIYAVAHDITDRKQTEAALRESEARFRSLAASSPIGIFLNDAAGACVYTNPRWQEITGKTLEESLGEGGLQAIASDDREAVVAEWQACVEAGREFSREFRCTRSAEDVRWVYSRAAVVRSATGLVSGYVGTLEDITERKQVGEALSRSEERLRAVVNNMVNGLITIHEHGSIESFNPAAEKIFGYEAAEVIGQNVKLLMPEPYHSEHDGYLSNYLRTGQKKIIGIRREVVGRRKDGRLFPMDLDLSDFLDGEHRMFAGLVRDITEHKQIEAQLRRQIEEELRHRTQELLQANIELTRSNKELDDFAYIASHDLKEPLRGLNNYAVFLLEDYGNAFDDEGRAKLETLPRLALRMETLIDSLLHYSRVGRVDLAIGETNLGQIVAEVYESLAISLQEENIEVRIPTPLPTIRCDKARVGEVFRNLIINAMKYNDKPQKWIEIGVVDADDGRANGINNGGSEPPALAPQVFYVCDNGIGIREKHLEAVFRLFKRLHGRDKYQGGTGAGLTIVKKIIERHEGRIWIDSTPGEGSTFYFTLEREGRNTHASCDIGATNPAC